MKIHPSSNVQSKQIGRRTQIWQYCIVLPNAVIGENCNINCHVFIENKVEIGNNVTIKSGVQIWDGINIEDNVFIGPNATFTNDLYPRSQYYPKSFSGILVKKGASIGANATILAGVTIGEYSMVGAGSLVSKNIPAFTLWYGNPAKHKGYVTKEGKIISLDLFDKEGNKYSLIKKEPVMQTQKEKEK